MSDKDKLIVCGGCNSKIGPGDLSSLLKDLPRLTSEKLIVGFDHKDDAAVVEINDNQVLIQTLDFFPTMVTDPYLFGKIAAANALSDIYAMGGTVLSALNIVAFPEEKDLSILREILLGGAEKVKEAGGILAGGHSIHDNSVKYGLSVTGLCNKNQIIQNNTCCEGDYLLITKPLGVGIVTTGYSIGEIDEESFNQATYYMQLLNKYAMEIVKKYSINSCTDITGFGLLGHLNEMLDGKFSAELLSEKIPYIGGAYKGAKEFILTAGGQRNRNYLSEVVKFNINDFAMEEILFDPQTSGGLLISVSEVEKNKIIEELEEKNIFVAEIGKIVTKNEFSIYVN